MKTLGRASSLRLLATPSAVPGSLGFASAADDRSAAAPGKAASADAKPISLIGLLNIFRAPCTRLLPVDCIEPINKWLTGPSRCLLFSSPLRIRPLQGPTHGSCGSIRRNTSASLPICPARSNVVREPASSTPGAIPMDHCGMSHHPRIPPIRLSMFRSSSSRFPYAIPAKQISSSWCRRPISISSTSPGIPSVSA